MGGRTSPFFDIVIVGILVLAAAGAYYTYDALQLDSSDIYGNETEQGDAGMNQSQDGNESTQEMNETMPEMDVTEENDTEMEQTDNESEMSVAPDFEQGIWMDAGDIMDLPMEGEAWQNILEAAQEDTSSPDLSDQDDDTNVNVLAKALVYVRTGEPGYRDEVLQALEVITYEDTEDGGRTLALGRELVAYVTAADMIGLEDLESALDSDFREKLSELLTKELDGKTLVFTHEDRPNNWGTAAGASRAAVAYYLEEEEEMQKAAEVFKGWLGDRDTYASFDYGDLCWQADPENPVGINPPGALMEIEGELRNVDGVLPDDQRRGNDGPDFNGGCPEYVGWPPEKQNYIYTSLQGVIVQAAILERAGYDVWEWEDQAIKRAFDWLHTYHFENGENYPAEGDDEWQPWLVNYAYCTDYPATEGARPGKNMGWTDWTHAENPEC